MLEERLMHDRPIKYRPMAQFAEDGDEISGSAKV